MSLLDRQKELYGWLVRGFPEYDLPGFPERSAIAAVANGTQENLCRPVTIGQKDHNSDGIFQWRLERLGPETIQGSLKGWAAANGQPWDTIRTQAAFFMWELKNGDEGKSIREYAALYGELLAGVKPLATLVTNINRAYERSADDAVINQKRINYALQFQAAIGGAPPVIKPAIVVGGAVAGSVVAATVHSWANIQIDPTIAVLVLSNLVSAGVAGWSLWKQSHQAIIVHEEPEPEPAIAPEMPPDPSALLKDAIASLAPAIAAVEAAKATIAARKEALAADLEAKQQVINQAMELLKP